MAKTVVITGGTGGLGGTVCRTFLSSGWQVLTTYRSDSELKELLDSLGEHREKLDAIRVDVTDESSLDELSHRLTDKYGQINSLICLVGGFKPGTLGTELSQNFDQMFNLNTKSFILTVNTVLPYLKLDKKALKSKNIEWRSITAVAARPALQPTAGNGIYSASKAAIINLVQTLNLELKNDYIRVNAIAPSTIDTPANRAAMPKADSSKWVKPQSIADSLLFLSSSESEAINGAIVPLYGQA